VKGIAIGAAITLRAAARDSAATKILYIVNEVIVLEI
jgi:hypothetical protein